MGEIKHAVDDLGLRGCSNSPIKESGDFDDSDFYGFGDDVENASLWKLEIQDGLNYKQRELET